MKTLTFTFLFFIVLNDLYAKPNLTPYVFTNFWGNQKNSNSYKEPNSLNELISLVKINFKSSTKYRVAGARHANSLTAHSKEMIIDLHKMPRYLNFNKTTSTLTISSWVSLLEANEYLFKYGRVLSGTPSIGHQTIGGSIATGSHSEGETPLLSDSVSSMSVLLPNGELKEITDEKELSYHRVSLGLLGVITEVTLKTIPLRRYKIISKYQKINELKPLEIIHLSNSTERFLIDYFPYSKIARIRKWQTIEDDSIETTPPESEIDYESLLKFNFGKLSFHYPPLFNFLMNQELENRLNKKTELVSAYSPNILLENFARPDEKKSWGVRLLYSLPSKTKDFEIAVPIASLLATLNFITLRMNDFYKENNIFHPFPLFIRFGKKSKESVLGMNANRDTAFIIIPISKDEHLQKTFAKELINKYSARIHLGKYSFNFNSTLIFKNYNQDDVKDFLNYRKKLDPTNLLINDWAKRLISRDIHLK